jgi:small subunit ribosomal protein S13
LARIEGVDLPRQKPIWIALTYIFGIGQASARAIVEGAGVASGKRVFELTDHEIARVREIIQQDYRVEGELRKQIAMNIKRLIDLNTYRGLRHRRGLPVRGQRTHTNSRTRKGPRRSATKRK